MLLTCLIVFKVQFDDQSTTFEVNMVVDEVIHCAVKFYSTIFFLSLLLWLWSCLVMGLLILSELCIIHTVTNGFVGFHVFIHSFTADVLIDSWTSVTKHPMFILTKQLVSCLSLCSLFCPSFFFVARSAFNVRSSMVSFFSTRRIAVASCPSACAACPKRCQSIHKLQSAQYWTTIWMSGRSIPCDLVSFDLVQNKLTDHAKGICAAIPHCIAIPEIIDFLYLVFRCIDCMEPLDLACH